MFLPTRFHCEHTCLGMEGGEEERRGRKEEGEKKKKKKEFVT